jgi:hypothetical protein
MITSYVNYKVEGGIFKLKKKGNKIKIAIIRSKYDIIESGIDT